MATTTPKLIKLRWPGACDRCSAQLVKGASAWWHAGTKTITCERCSSSGGETHKPALPDAGVAGASARREAARRRRNRGARVRAEHPILGDLILRATDEPHHISAFDVGAVGEEVLARRLDSRRYDGILALHDRARSRSRGNIDHIVIAPAGVFVVDAKHYSGRVRRRSVGGLFDMRERLYVEQRDCTALVAKVRSQAAEVAEALDIAGWRLPIHPTLCFVEADWGFSPRPFLFDRVLIAWPEALLSQLTEPKAVDFDTVCSVAEFLAARFPSA